MVARLILKYQQVNNIDSDKPRRKVVHWNCEQGHDQLFSDYFFKNLVHKKINFEEGLISKDMSF